MALATHQPDLPSYIRRTPTANNPIVAETVNQFEGTKSIIIRHAAMIPRTSEIEPPTSLTNLPLASILHSRAMTIHYIVLI